MAPHGLTELSAATAWSVDPDGVTPEPIGPGPDEERCGVARSVDLRRWERVSLDGPSVGTGRGAGGVRYVDVTEQGDVFYEFTRADGAHELRGIVADR